MTNIISNIDRDKLTWVLPDYVYSNILDSLIMESKKEYNNNKNAFSDITLNLFLKQNILILKGLCRAQTSV